MRKWGQHFVLPGQIALLRRTMSDAKGDVMRRHSSERAVTEYTSEDQLLLVIRDGVLLHSDEDAIPLFYVRRGPLAVRREDHVVRSEEHTSELQSHSFISH